MKNNTNTQQFSNKVNPTHFSLMICVGAFRSDATHELRDFLVDIQDLAKKKTKLNPN